MVAVVITQNDAIERAIAEALQHLPLDVLVHGKVVAVKPNDTWALPEDCAVHRRLWAPGTRR
jgi:hypothetical protein